MSYGGENSYHAGNGASYYKGENSSYHEGGEGEEGQEQPFDPSIWLSVRIFRTHCIFRAFRYNSKKLFRTIFNR